MKRFGLTHFRPYLLGAAAGALGMLLLPLSGLIESSAEPGRWALGDWFTYVSARQSVTLRSLGTEVPDNLDDPARLRRAAGHYQLVCAACHGSPTRPPEQFARDLVPAPPRLTERMAQWRPDARIFHTVKHGIRGSAMPAWPTQMRDDEVWDMVAFLKVLSDMAEPDYAALVTPEGDCAMCHGEKGEGLGDGLPRLDIQSPAYLEAALKTFRDGTRQSGTMIAVAHTLADADIDTLARRYGLSLPHTTNAADEGAVIARSGIPERDIPACDSCHGSGARADYPRLAGQDATYLLTQLTLFMDYGAARGGPRAPIMAEAVKHLSPEEAETLAIFYSTAE